MWPGGRGASTDNSADNNTWQTIYDFTGSLAIYAKFAKKLRIRKFVSDFEINLTQFCLIWMQ